MIHTRVLRLLCTIEDRDALLVWLKVYRELTTADPVADPVREAKAIQAEILALIRAGHINLINALDMSCYGRLLLEDR